ncbi:MAG: thioredoxin domain-containing protein [Candidatus Zixiibacteriota bacterium]
MVHDMAVLTILTLCLAMILGCSRIGEEAMHTKTKNRLANAASPYLQAHADNPVDWFEWSDEAFEKARVENKPIFLSIGYNACHWCHVMEHESFENDEIAQILNKFFVSIKVDREERPDIDQVYMSALTSMTGSGGWPMSIFMTPEKKPFYAGTYFPPTSNYGRPGFKDILTEIAAAYESRNDDILRTADMITSRLSQSAVQSISPRPISREVLISGADEILRNVDFRNGGFGSRPKFPQSQAIEFLFRASLLTKNDEYSRAGYLTLNKMSEGGIYDHLGGGFHRYSVDEKWLIPHFEKMLYDNALLVNSYLEAYQLTGEEEYLDIVTGTLDFLTREMTDSGGGFYSTMDADSDGEEGKFYVWKKSEIYQIMGDDSDWICRYYGVTEAGNFEHDLNILHLGRHSQAVIDELNLSPEEFRKIIEKVNLTLFDSRSNRVAPAIDDKILVSWNGLAISAFSRAHQVTGEIGYLTSAKKAADFILGKLHDDGKLYHSYRYGKILHVELLEDYAYFIAGLLDLYQASFDENYLGICRQLTDRAIDLFYDSGQFFSSAADNSDLIFRPRDISDGATPSPAFVMIRNLQYLAAITGDVSLFHIRDESLTALSGLAAQSPQATATLLMAGYFALSEPIEIVISGDNAKKMTRFNREIFSRFLPNKIVIGNTNGEKSNLSLLQGRQEVDELTYFFCRDRVCRLPVTDFAGLSRELSWLSGQ